MSELIKNIYDIKELSNCEFDEYFGDNEFARKFKLLVISGDIPFLKIKKEQKKHLLDEIYILLKKMRIKHT